MAYKEWRQLSFTKEDQEFNCGVHKGCTIIDIMKREPEFIVWCLSSVKKFKLGKKMQVVWESLQ
jgi:hypothetical protein